MKRKLLYFTSCCVVFLISCSAQEDFGNLVSSPVNASKPDTISKPETEDPTNTPIDVEEPIVVSENNIVAHRGAWKKNNLPQNSIASLREAIRLNCKGSEFDIHITADDSLVVSHEPQYNNIRIKDSKYADLIKLKLANGETLPTLREYILAAKTNNKSTLLFCEFKNDVLSWTRVKVFISKALECVKKLNAQEMMVYTSYDYGLLKQIRVLNVEADIRYISGDATPEQLKLDKMTGTAYYIDVFKTTHPDWLERMRKNNLIVGAGNANDVATINWCLANLDYICSDEPELALQLSNH